MKVISREEAVKCGLRSYFTGKACPSGHVAERYVSNYYCRYCHAEDVARLQLRVATSRRADSKCFLLNLYRSMQQRVRGNRGRPAIYKGLPLMSRDDFMAWALNDPAFTKLFAEWPAHGYAYKFCPSIDRVDTQRGYVSGNVQFITQSQNSQKAGLWKNHGINPITKAAHK